jgi:hypothetical protein
LKLIGNLWIGRILVELFEPNLSTQSPANVRSPIQIGPIQGLIAIVDEGITGGRAAALNIRIFEIATPVLYASIEKRCAEGFAGS